MTEDNRLLMPMVLFFGLTIWGKPSEFVNEATYAAYY